MQDHTDTDDTETVELTIETVETVELGIQVIDERPASWSAPATAE
jgi:hypothetical protein